MEIIINGGLQEIIGVWVQGNEVTGMRFEHSSDQGRSWIPVDGGFVYEIPVTDDVNFKKFVKFRASVHTERVRFIPMTWKGTIKLRAAVTILKREAGGIVRYSARE